MLNINKQTIIHIIVESVIIIGITVYFNKKNNKLEKKIEEIYKKYEIQEDLIKKNDEIIKSLTEHIQILYKQNKYYEIQSQNEKSQNEKSQNEIKIQSQNEIKIQSPNEIKIQSQNEKSPNEIKIQSQNEIKYGINISEIKIQKPKLKMEIEEIEEEIEENLDKEIESELSELNN